MHSYIFFCVGWQNNFKLLEIFKRNNQITSIVCLEKMPKGGGKNQMQMRKSLGGEDIAYFMHVLGKHFKNILFQKNIWFLVKNA